jgi:hypothetical protein
VVVGGAPGGEAGPLVQLQRVLLDRGLGLEQAAGAGAGAGAGGGDGAGGRDNRPQTAQQRHFTMANLACYPAINIPNGFGDTGRRPHVTFFARPFAKWNCCVCEGVTGCAGFHLKRPTKLDT